MFIIIEQELSHHGVKGMKWGVRKDQGSLMGRYHRRAASSVQKDIDSFKQHPDGIKNKKGKVIVSKKSVEDSIKGLETVRNKSLAKAERADTRSYNRRKAVKSAVNRYRNITGSRRSAATIKYRKKNIDGMSDQDLRKAVNRMNLERQYRDLTRVDFMRGQKTAADILKYNTTYTNALKKVKP